MSSLFNRRIKKQWWTKIIK